MLEWTATLTTVPYSRNKACTCPRPVRTRSGHAVDGEIILLFAAMPGRSAALAIGTKVALSLYGGPQAVTCARDGLYREVVQCAGKATDGGGPPDILPMKIA